MTAEDDALQLPEGLIEALSGPDSAGETPEEIVTELIQEEITLVREYDVTDAPVLDHWRDGRFTPKRAELTFVWWDYGMAGREWRLTHAKAQGWTGEHPGVTEIDFPTVGLPDDSRRRPDWLNDLVNKAAAEMALRKMVKT